MSGWTTNLVALVRALVLGIGSSLIVGAIGYFVMRDRKDWARRKPVLIMGAIGVMLVLTVGIYYAWPTLVTVPSLDGLSQAQAEDSLVKQGLVPDGRPQYVPRVEAGRVVPHSQNPSQGISVRPSTVVSFAVSLRPDQPQGDGPPPGTLAVSLFEPKSSGKIRCSRGADGIYKFSVRGTSSGLSIGGFGLLLWLRPVNPPSDTAGWYLQRPPANGIERIEADRLWVGIAQLGNAQYPPREGDIVDLAVTVADSETANRLMAERGVVLRNQPVGTKSDTASGVIVTLK